MRVDGKGREHISGPAPRTVVDGPKLCLAGSCSIARINPILLEVF